MGQENANNPALLVDNEPYRWEKPTISGAELRILAGVPENVQIFQHIPGQPDKEIHDDTVVDLREDRAPERFSTQATDSRAGTGYGVAL